MAVRVLDVGNCDPDHGSIRAMLTSHYDVEVDRVMFVPEALAAIERTRYGLVLVNRLVFADESDGMELVRALCGRAGSPPIMLLSNYPDAQARAVDAGALPGFGKAALRDPGTHELLARVLPAKRSK